MYNLRSAGYSYRTKMKGEACEASEGEDEWEATDSVAAATESSEAESEGSTESEGEGTVAKAKAPKYNHEEKTYVAALDPTEKLALVQLENQLRQTIQKDAIPLRFKILNSTMDERSKHLILYKLEQFQQMNDQHSDYFKLKQWLHSVCQIPLHTYKNLPVNRDHALSDIRGFMYQVKTSMDATVYGHADAKNQIMQIIAQWISNPSSHGHCIGIQGAMGTGKTSLVKDGISKALGMPFGFVTLGGASDGSFLEGHSFAYEGASYGKISEILIKTQCMNPIIFFDELDKVSGTKKGAEIISILTHLTDASQNNQFNDRYFGELDLDLSRALMVFSYNDESLINPILKDRMITIRVKGYTVEEKCVIARDYLLPKILESYGFLEGEVVFPEAALLKLIPKEEGVRHLRRRLEKIIGWLNMHRYLPSDYPIAFPCGVSDDLINRVFV